MKKVWLLVVVMLLAAIFTACTDAQSTETETAQDQETVSNDASTDTSSAPEETVYEIGYIMFDSDTWGNALIAGYLWGAEKMGANATVFDAQQSSEEQINQAQEFIDRGVDLIALSPTSPETAATIVRMCNENNVPITIENMFVADDGSIGDIAGQVACQYSDIGYAAVMYIAEHYPGCKLLYCHYQEGLGFAEAYMEGVNAALDEVGDAVELVGYINGNFDAETAYASTQDFITSGKEFDVAFANNDAIANGMIQAMTEADITGIPIISTGGAPDGWNMVLSGEQTANMTAPANLQGMLHFKLGWDYLMGNPMEQTKIALPIIPCDASNMETDWIKWDDMDAAYAYINDHFGGFSE